MSDLDVEAALRCFDDANGGDPRLEPEDAGGQPRELIYGRRMSAMLARFCPGATPELRLAARAQHLCRWRLPRADFPPGRLGYLDWRRECGRMHARLAAEILGERGASEEVIETVTALLEKRHLGSDPRAQQLEDTACLVFLESYLEDFCRDRQPEQPDRILRRTWRKMSPQAREFSAGLALGSIATEVLSRALGTRQEVLS